MKIAALSVSLLATALAVSATALPDQHKVSDGLFKSYFDQNGNEVTDFVPWNELGNTTFVPITSVVPAESIKQRSTLMKRREGCHPSASVPTSETDAANKCLIDSFSSDPIVITANGYRKYSCIYGNAVSYYCSYNTGPIFGPGTTTRKYKSDVRGTWDYVKRTLCGFNRLGYAKVINGDGLVTAGYTYNGDGFCY
ncbi:hypothetical protein DL764_004393 [Monosporascus ibericus]|uniref:Ecp2 effector protein domain-containing protein n=1 Tax=Monosporascus ibericus TaxID=155417 RepID=A0A4Q4TCT2_9PEZI|nr:hypothetical protein DL764_004393 [Monosporascus ibericus]